MKKLMLALATCVAALVVSAEIRVVTVATDTFPEATAGSLRAALAAAQDGDTITFDDSLKGQTITIVGVNTAKDDTSLVIDKAITIDGNGVVIDGGWDGVSRSSAGGRIFYIPADLDKVTIKNITLQNGHGRGWDSASKRYFPGGAVCALSPVRFEGCRFYRNYAADEAAYHETDRDGGAIHAESALELFDCEFDACGGGAGNSMYAGAILVDSGSLVAKNVIATNNSAGSYGGGFLVITSDSSLFCENVVVEDAFSAYAAGAIRVHNTVDNGSSVTRIFKNCAFRRCFVKEKEGGAIFSDGPAGRFVFDGCEFEDCGAAWGGAVRLNGAYGIFVNCTLHMCNGDQWGPALDIRSGASFVNCTLAGCFDKHGSDPTSSAVFCGGGDVMVINTVAAFNYYKAMSAQPLTGDDFHKYSGNLYFYNSLVNGNVYGATANASSGAFDPSQLFVGGMETVTSVRTVGYEPVALTVPCDIPTMTASVAFPGRVIGIAANGPLDGTGYPVKINEDYTWIQYSADGGATWTDFYKNGTPTTAPVLLMTDQRGIEYLNGRAPIGAAVVTPDPAAPYFKSPTAETTDAGAKITLSGITVGTDATTYDVYVYEGDNAAAAVKAAEGQTGATVTFALDDLSLGAHTYSVYLKNDRQVQSDAKTVTFLFEGPVTDDPNGSWVVTKLTENGDECVVNDGKLVYAFAKGASRVINDVMFEPNNLLDAATDKIEVFPAYILEKDNWNGNGCAAGSLPSGDWKSLLGNGWLLNSSDQGNSTFTFKGLTPGATYKVQLLVHDHADRKDPARSMFPPGLYGVDGYEAFYDQSSSGEHADWDLGSSLVGRFVATGAVHQLKFSYSTTASGSNGDGWFCLNAIQLREIRGPQSEPEPETPYEVTGEHKTIIDGDYVVYVWKNPARTATIKIPCDVKADYLVVGGGGAGGYCRGGGGGGGGVVYQTMQDFASGTYTITVGAGGVPDVFTTDGSCYEKSKTSETANGGSSSISFSSAVICEAFGGGGGGNYVNNQVANSVGLGYEAGVRNVATGGGSAGKNTTAPAGYEGQGFAGGTACGSSGDSSGGGGGAGSAGSPATAQTVAGNGGDGVSCAITGVNTYYGGGGGGGIYGDRNHRIGRIYGEGGLGGGGRGGVNENGGLMPGTDGFGGGGGGASGYDNKFPYCGGGAGGSGTVIIRLPIDPSSQTVPPSFKLATPTVDGRAATIKLNNIVLGTDSTGESVATSYDIYAYTGDDPAAAVRYGEDLTAATAEFTLTGLVPGDYTYNVYIVNNGGLQSKTLSAVFTILPAVAPSATLATTVKGTDMKFGFSDIVIGTDAESHVAETYSILLAYAPQGEELPELQVVAADQTAATYEKEVLDLDESTTYAYTAIVSNNLGSVSAAITGTFTTGVYIETVDKLARKLGAGEWVGVPLTGQPSDVVSYGEEVIGSDGKVRAYINGDIGTDATISYVNFRNGWNETDLNMVFKGGYTDYGVAGTTGCYADLMKRGWYGNGNSDDYYTLHNLVSGQAYLIQIFVHDGRGSSYNNRNFGPGPGNNGNRIYFGEDTKETASPERGGYNWYYGGTLIHAFVATGTDYSFVINTASGSQQINAIQLRAIPTPKGSPKIGAVTANVEQGTAMVTLDGVAMGTDDEGTPATSYDIYAAIDDADPVKVLAEQAEAPVSFFVQNLAVGEHDVKVFVENNFGVVSPTNSIKATVVTADPDCYFPNGNWRSLPMTIDYSGLSTFGALNYALASSAGNNRIFTVNTIPYMEAYRDVHSGKTYYYSPYFETYPVFNAENDCFGQEDTSGDYLNSFLRRAWCYRDNGASGKITITLKQLEPGVRYTVQLTAHNNNPDSKDWYYPDGTMTAPDGVTAIQYGPVNDDNTWKYGGSLIGSFVASNTTHAFTFAYTPTKHFQLNTLQVRKTGEAPAVAPAYPTLDGASVFIGRGSATLTVGGLDAGVADGACDVYYALVEEGEPLGEYVRGATGVTGASCTFAISDVQEGKSYVYSVYAVNPASKLASTKVEGRFTIGVNPGIPEEMKVEPLIRPGLVQAKFGAGVLFGTQVQPPLVSNLLTQTDYVGQLDFTYGALMANHNCADENAKVLNTYTVTQWNWDNTNTVFAYEGEIHLQKGQRLAIYGQFDDGTAAVVDGVTLFAQGDQSGFNRGPAVSGVIYEVAETGWYPLNAWVWDWSSGKNYMTPPSSLSYNFSGITTINDQNRSQWKHLEDTDGMGSFLRFKEEKTLMTLGVPSTNGVDVTINAAFTDVPGAAKFVAYVSTSHDGGLDPLAWDEVIKIADIPSGNTAEANYTIKGLAAYPFVRFAIESEGSISTAERCRNFRQMSRVVGFDSDGLSILVASPVFTKDSGNFNVVVMSMGGATSLALDVQVSTDPAFGSTVYTGTIDGIANPGVFPVAVDGLAPGTTYYIRVKPTTAGDDAWIVSAPIETAEAGTVRINEIMASNGDSFKTKNGRSGLDWIEIYNGTDEVVDLADWYLYDDPTKAQAKWKKIQGSCVIPVRGYGIVWCDKDYTDWDAANEAWSEIGLTTDGETVFLAKPDGTVVDTVTFGTQMKEISYGVGKLPDETEQSHVYFKVPTPAAENGEYGYGPMTPTVAFSVPHGYKTEAFDVEITCEEDPDADIYYTLDGTQPTAENPKAVKYTAPIHVNKTTILRAGVPQANTVLQIDSSATYIFLDDVLSQPRATTGADVPAGFPESGFNGHDMRYGMIQSIVNGPDRERILRGFTNTIATISVVVDPDCLFNAENGIYVNPRKYMNEGEDGERPMLLEQIDPVHGAANEFSVPGGLRLRGAGSRDMKNAKHAFRFFFRGKYGMPKLKFPLFGDEGADEFAKVDLRCSQNYSWSYNNSDCETFVHEVFSRDSQRDLGQVYTRSRYYNLFVNGQYWGLYQTQERGDEDFAETYLGGDKDYYDCIKTWTASQWEYKTSAKNGNDRAWRNLQGLAYYGFSGDYINNYNRALGLNPDGSRNESYPILLNPENLMAYVTIAHFVCDADGPVSVNSGNLNNLYANRYQIDGGSDMDGFWFLRHDAEHSMGVTNFNEGTFAPWTQYTADPTGIGTYEGNPLLNQDLNNGYRGDPPEKDNGGYSNFGPYQLNWMLAKNPTYKRMLGDFFYKHYLKEGGAMTPAVAKQRFEARMAEIDDVVVSEAARWSWYENQPKSRETWLTACSNCLDFIDNRTAYMKTQYRNRGWYPSINVPEPDVEEAAVGETVTFSVLKDDGETEEEGYEVVYTTDGSDPADSATAVTAKTLMLTTLPCAVKARALKNGEYSALQEVEYKSAAPESDGYTFIFEGEYAGDQIIAPTGTECVVILKGATINGSLVLPDGVKAYLCPTNGTENTVQKIIGEGAHLTLKDFDGLGGKVSLEGEDTLISVSNLVVKSGVLDIKSTGVTATQTPIVNVLGHVKQDGGEINIDLSAVSADPAKQAYGIYVKNKDPEDADGKNLEIIYAEFNGGEFNAKVGGWKSAALYIDKGSVEATFNEGSTNNVELVGPEARFVNASGDLNLKGGEFKVVMPGEYSSLTNARVFKSDKEIKIKGGHYDVNVPGPGSEIFSAVKDKKDSIITVKDGTFELIADDDCFSADDRIDIQGGLFYAVSLNNDVFDSNGDMLVSGGTIMAYATAAGHEAFDVEPEVQGKEVSSYTHQLTINGGTIFATGGKNAAWPTIVNVGDGVNLYKATEISASTISEQYASIKGTQAIEGSEDPYVVTTTAKLPVFLGSNGALLMTCPNMTAGAVPTYSGTAPTKGDQQFHYLYISSNLPSNQEFVRIYEVYGSTNDGNKGDTGEYFILTNVSGKVVQLAGLTVTFAKYDTKNNTIESPKLNITLTEGTIPAGGTVRFDQADFTGKGWDKITNGMIYFQIINDENVVVQSGFGKFDNDLFPKTDRGGAALRAKRFDNETPLEATQSDWKSTAKSSGFLLIVR